MMQHSVRDDNEISSNIYKFIDQAYSWALEGMKFVTRLKMDECSSLESCRRMIEEFDCYMENHPAIPEEDFRNIEELCQQSGNTKAMSQCNYARTKCQDTSTLFRKRRDLLRKIKLQFKAANKKRLNEHHKARNDKENEVETSARRPSKTPSDATSVDEAPESDNSSPTNSPMVVSASSTPVNNRRTAIALHPNAVLSTKASSKPSRKILKKATSAPLSHVTQHGVRHHQSQSGVTLTIGSPVQVVPVADNTSGKPKVSLIIDELIATERDYVRSLNYVVENYFPEMCRLDIPQALRCKRNVIFGNIEKIAEFHSRYFLADLESCYDNPLRVAEAFQLHKESFALYALYSKNKPQSDQLLYEHGNEFFKAKQLELGDKMDLASYLLKPIQRMGKYALLLRAMSKECSEVEERGLRDAVDLVKFQLRHGNDLLTMDSIRECDVNLKEQGNLLRQEQFVIFSGRRRIVRRVFLFEDLILFSKPLHTQCGHDVYQYKCSYKTAEIGLTENIGESGYKFEIWFRRRRAQATHDRFVLQSSSRSSKRAWVEEIRGLLWKQAVRNKNHRSMEMSSMGVGSKPHLDLAALSKNRITDRSVVVLPPGDKHLLADRLAKSRTRSSIAVSHFASSEQQKRPYSIISSSSSSSSVGSGSLVSSLQLASWLPKAEQKQPKCFTPPMAYCDFHAIAEDANEQSETSSAASSCSTNESEQERNRQLTRQYLTTTNTQQLAVK